MTEINGAPEDPNLAAARQVVHEKSRLKKLFSDPQKGLFARLAHDMWQPYFKVMIEFKRAQVGPRHCANAFGEWVGEALFQLASQSGDPQSTVRAALNAMTGRLNEAMGHKKTGLILPGQAGPGLVKAKLDTSKLKL